MISVGRHEDVFFIKAEHQTVTATAAITKDEAIRLRDYLNHELPDEEPEEDNDEGDWGDDSEF